MIDGKVLNTSLITPGFRAMADGAKTSLANEHLHVGATGYLIVDGSLEVKSLVSMPEVVALLSGELFGMNVRFGIVVAAVLAAFLGSGTPPGR